MKLYKATRVVLVLADDLDKEMDVIDIADKAMGAESEDPEVEEITPAEVRTLMPHWLDAYPWVTRAACEWPQSTVADVLEKMEEDAP